LKLGTGPLGPSPIKQNVPDALGLSPIKQRGVGDGPKGPVPGAECSQCTSDADPAVETDNAGNRRGQLERDVDKLRATGAALDTLETQ